MLLCSVTEYTILSVLLLAHSVLFLRTLKKAAKLNTSHTSNISNTQKAIVQWMVMAKPAHFRQ